MTMIPTPTCSQRVALQPATVFSFYLPLICSDRLDNGNLADDLEVHFGILPLRRRSRWSRITSPMSGRATGRSPLAKVRLDGPVRLLQHS